MKAIPPMWHQMENYMSKKQGLHMVFVNLKKVQDKVSRGVLWWVMEKQYMANKYTIIVPNTYKLVKSNVSKFRGVTKCFPILIGLHQAYAMYPFVMVQDHFTKM